MQNEQRKFSRAIFGIAIFCFFLPFVNVSCSEHKIVTFTGAQLITGTTIKEPSMFGKEPEEEKVDGEPLAAFALLSAVIGFLVSFLKVRSGKSTIVPAITGATGAIMLLLLKARVDSDVLKEGEGILQAQYEIGFWLTLLLFISAAGLNGFVFFQSEEAPQQDVMETATVPEKVT